jgi:hypothetical protein
MRLPHSLSPQRLTIQPGEQVLTRLVISRLPSGTVIDVPVHVMRSTEPGPTLLLMGGMHGDEVNGIETIGGWCGASCCSRCGAASSPSPFSTSTGF